MPHQMTDDLVVKEFTKMNAAKCQEIALSTKLKIRRLMKQDVNCQMRQELKMVEHGVDVAALLKTIECARDTYELVERDSKAKSYTSGQQMTFERKAHITQLLPTNNLPESSQLLRFLRDFKSQRKK